MARELKIGLTSEPQTGRGTITVKLSAKVNRPLAYAGDWLISRAVKVKVSGA